MSNSFKLIPKVSLYHLLIIAFHLLIAGSLLLPAKINAQSAFPGADVSLQEQTIDDICKRRNLSPDKCQELKTRLSKTGDRPVRESIQTPKEGFDCFTPEDTKKGLKIFGHDIFRRVPIMPPQNLPVPSDYTIGPGDEIDILIWGRVNARYALTVSREGAILLPEIGSLSVAGKTFQEMKRYITRQAKNIVGAEVSITMGRLKSIQVFVLGEVRNPGVYSLSAMSTVTNALMAACGPTRIGTLRRVELKRAGKTIVKMDLYDLLLKGDKSKDLMIRNSDVIFVPVVGPLVSISSDIGMPPAVDEVKRPAVDEVKRPAVDNIRRPAIYELRGKTRLLDLIQMAGGLSATAFRGRIQLQRIEDHRARTVYEGDLINIKKNPNKNFILKDGDLIKLFPIADRKNTMIINGAIVNPGEYGVISGETKVSDVVTLAGGLLYYA
ncbi:MAG: SLBB domain-containing protein, partial [Thermodesulfobacteriota bacterium]